MAGRSPPAPRPAWFDEIEQRGREYRALIEAERVALREKLLADLEASARSTVSRSTHTG